MASKAQPTAASVLGASRRITVKVGSSLLARPAQERRLWLASLASDLAALRADDRQIVIVSSGAVALGREALGLRASSKLDHKQAAAAVGQPLLMAAWAEAFAEYDLPTAQLLLTIGDTEARRPWLNARATLAALLDRGVVPIVNENDSVATEELRYGDNDRLSARVAQMVTSDLLILLSDVDGLYGADPSQNPDARRIAIVHAIDAKLRLAAGVKSSSGLGSGGMATKLEAAAIAQASGCATIICSGRGEHPIRALADNEAAGTLVIAQQTARRAYKTWIAGSLSPSGTVIIDDGAATALSGGRSLLPSGVIEVTGDFDGGSCVRVQDSSGKALGQGLIRYSSAEARTIAGKRASDIEGLLGYTRGDELIHRDDLAVRND
ncbi:MAG: glutamate 5-kinase [Sphingomonas sp.]|nr:glutamate 5-kinase [Sphingomonas sp.]